MSTFETYLGLGSNLPQQEDHLRRGLAILAQHPAVHLTAWSSLYVTEPEDLPGQPWFYNCAARVETDLEPFAMLRLCKTAETRVGRVPGEPKGPRILDIDLLLVGHILLRSPQLVLPHPRLHLRHFVLYPLMEIAPDLMHPGFSVPLRALWSVLPEKGGKLLRIRGPEWFERGPADDV